MQTLDQVDKTFGSEAVNREGFLFMHVSALKHDYDLKFKVEARNYAGVALADHELDQIDPNIDYEKVKRVEATSDDFTRYDVYEFAEQRSE